MVCSGRDAIAVKSKLSYIAGANGTFRTPTSVLIECEIAYAYGQTHIY